MLPGFSLLGLFEKRIEGDDCLLELARLRFEQAGMGAEFYAGAPEELDRLLKFNPSVDVLPLIHLGRGLNLLEDRSRDLIAGFASRFAGRVRGLVLHDQKEMATRSLDYIHSAQELERRLEEVRDGPYVFIEYAVGLEPAEFAEFFRRIQALERIGACIDTGHVGIRQTRNFYARYHPGEDLSSLGGNDSRLLELTEDVEKAVRSALPAVLRLVADVGALGKPFHLHLHDGHPLSRTRPYGVSDHQSFLTEIPIDFEYKGRRSVPPMFGPSGLTTIATAIVQVPSPSTVTASLEIHPTDGRLPLEDARGLFPHWQDKTNAERMNYWLSVLSLNCQWIRKNLATNSTG